MAVDHWWLGTTNADHAVAANWSTAGSGGAPGISVPGTGDEVLFDGNGNNPCTLSANLALLHLTTVAGYTAKFDAATFNITMDDGGNVTLDGGGEFDLGSGMISLTNGTWDVVDQATLTRGASTVAFDGTCTVNTGVTNDFHNLSVLGGTTTVSTNDTETNGTTILTGALSVDVGRTFRISGICTIILNDGSRLTGNGVFLISNPGSGEGITTFHSGATVDISRINIALPNAAAILTSGNYQSAVRVFVNSAVASILTLDAAGAYQFDSLELETTSTGSLALANNTNGPASITVNGDLTFDRDSTGVITIDDSGQATDWVITGDVVNEGAATWVKGTGDITASGTAAQAWDWGAVTGEIEDVVIDKSAGTLTLGGNLDCTSFTLTDGDLDTNGNDITTTGDFDIAAGATLADPVGSTLTVGGNFTADGNSIIGSGSWALTVTGTADATGTGSVAYSDASGGTQIEAWTGPWTDSLNNQNWDFQNLTLPTGIPLLGAPGGI